MTNENKKLWYKDIRYWAIFLTSVTAIISSPLWGPIIYPEPDFSVSVKPMQGAVQQGGIISPSITVKGIQGYEHQVSLSATGQPSGVVPSFEPPFGDAKPSYTSSVTINVDSNVPVRDYIIKIKGTGADGTEHSCTYTLTVKPSVVTPLPSPTPTITKATPTSTTTPCIIDTMDSIMGWNTHNDDKGSLINKKLIPGRTNKAIEITYDLKEWGWVTFNKQISPNELSEIEGIRFFYKGTGKPNTIELKLIYSDKDKYGGEDTTFGYAMHAATVEDDWICVEVPYSKFDCWWSDKSCDDNPELDLNNVRKIEFAISNKPEGGDEKGSGKVIIDDVQGIMSTTPTPASTFNPINIGDNFFPSSWMGDWGDITFEGSWTENTHSKPTCIKIDYSASKSQGEGWVGIYWQYPANNWGDNPNGIDLTGATKLTFWAKGEKGGEKAEFKVGGITGTYPDSIQPSISTGIIVLSNEWNQFTIDLTGKDLSHVIGGFFWTTGKSQNPSGSTIYLEDIIYE